MLLQLNDDGILDKVDEEHLVNIDERELDEFIEKYKKLEKENEELKQQNNELIMVIKGIGRDTAQILSKNWKHWTYGDD